MRPVLPLRNDVWIEVFTRVVEDFRRERKPVGVPSEGEQVDLLFVVYEASDHALIRTENRLEALLSAIPEQVAKVMICVCDLASPDVTEEEARDLAIRQVPAAYESAVRRSVTSEDFAVWISAEIQRRISLVSLAPEQPAGSELSLSSTPELDDLPLWGM